MAIGRKWAGDGDLVLSDMGPECGRSGAGGALCLPLD